MLRTFTAAGTFFSNTCCVYSTIKERRKLIKAERCAQWGWREAGRFRPIEEEANGENRIPLAVSQRSCSLVGSSPLQEMWQSVMGSRWFACASLSRLLRITVQGKRQDRVGAASSPRGCWRAGGPWLCWRWWMFLSSVGWKTGYNAGCVTPMGHGENAAELNDGLLVQESVGSLTVMRIMWGGRGFGRRFFPSPVWLINLVFCKKIVDWTQHWTFFLARIKLSWCPSCIFTH